MALRGVLPIWVGDEAGVGREDVDRVPLPEEGCGRVGHGHLIGRRVVAFRQYGAREAGGGDEAQIVPLPLYPQVGERIVGRIGLGDGGGALEVAYLLGGILRIVALDPLEDRKSTRLNSSH